MEPDAVGLCSIELPSPHDSSTFFMDSHHQAMSLLLWIAEDLHQNSGHHAHERDRVIPHDHIEGKIKCDRGEGAAFRERLERGGHRSSKNYATPLRRSAQCYLASPSEGRPFMEKLCCSTPQLSQRRKTAARSVQWLEVVHSARSQVLMGW